eukprot:162858-Pleurochrysis_carterae.AAC.1
MVIRIRRKGELGWLRCAGCTGRGESGAGTCLNVRRKPRDSEVKRRFDRRSSTCPCGVRTYPCSIRGANDASHVGIHVRILSTHARRLICEQSQDGCWEETDEGSLTVVCIRQNEATGSG